VIVGGGVTAWVAFYLCTDEESRGETVREAKAFSLKSHVLDDSLQKNDDD
jgi:alpha-galactosidase